MSHRILITGINCQISREAFVRAARLVPSAALHSGATPKSAAGGTRAPTDMENSSPEYQPLCRGPELPQTFRLGADHRGEWRAVYYLVAVALSAACLFVAGVSL